MRYTITSRKLKQDFDFWAPCNGGYIRLEYPGKEGTLGDQICQGGGFRGNTLSAKTEEQFEAVCRGWYRQHLQKFAHLYE